MLRRDMRRRRAAFAAAFEGAMPSFPDTASLAERLDRGVPVASYSPVGGEISPAPLEDMARAAQAWLCWPRIDADGAMRFYDAGPSRRLERGPLGFCQPPADARRVHPAVILVPLIAFDRRGNRLGQGGGHYDRALAGLPGAWKVGVAWSAQELPGLPREAWDIPLDAIVTEKEWIAT